MTARASRTRLKIWLVVVGVFALGCLTGALLDGAYRLQASSSSERPEARARRGKEDVFESMKRDLNLNEQQATEIRAILDQTRNEYRALRAEVRPRYDALRQNSRTRIRALLTPEQQKLFDAKVAERDARRSEDDDK
jgi:succinate dehydrogenase/fumarate reductase flavoprotein subunit